MDEDQQKLVSSVAQVHRVVGGVMGFGFAVLGIVMLGWLWFGAMNPPFMFRVIGSFVSMMFVAIGGSIGYAAVKGHPAKFMNRLGKLGQQRAGVGGYACPSCGAALANDADVSPSGDAKCAYCNRWFNIHAARS